jgi:hypothetical protein
MQLRRLLTASTSVLLVTVGLVTIQTSPAFAVSCPDRSYVGHGTDSNSFTGNGVNIRSGPSSTCTPLGQGQRSHSVSSYCRKGSWTAVFDHTTGIKGWVSEDFLDHFGVFPC